MVLALKNGVPVIVIDPVAGGDKVTRQAGKLGWGEVFDADQVSDEELAAALERCLSVEGHAKAATIREAAVQSLAGFDDQFAAAMIAPPQPELRNGLVPKVGKLQAWRKQFKAWKRSLRRARRR